MVDNIIEDDELTTPPVQTFEPGEAPDFEKPQYMVVGEKFFAQSEQGEVCLPMHFKTKQFRTMPPDLELLGQLWHLIDGDTKTQEQLDELDIEDARDIARKFFQAYTERQAVRRLGESRSSSRS